MFSTIQPHQYVALRLPSDAVKVEQMLPNTLVNLGKYGSFHTNQVIGRPFHLTFEILDRSESSDGRELRIVPAAELHADALNEDGDTPATYDDSTPGGEQSFENGGVITKSNMNIIDDPLNQKLTMAEIEALKQDDMAGSKELIARIMASHSTLDQKTAFSLAKYTLRKNKKYMRRFCVLPLDVASLADWMMNERDFAKVMEIRNEGLGLIGSWANAHSSGLREQESNDELPTSRYLVVDDTGGLIVAAIAERLGILHPPDEGAEIARNSDSDRVASGDESRPDTTSTSLTRPPPKRAMAAKSDTITLIHANTQPNLFQLRFFAFDSNNPNPIHPLYKHLKTLTWLQLLEPDSDPLYREPDVLPPDVLNGYKSSKRSAYYRKRRRWERTRNVVDETRAGGFNGLIIASYTSAVSILHHLVPLLAGGSQVVVYSPHVEPLVELVDLYSTARRTAFINLDEKARLAVPSADFPVDPTLLLSPMLQTARIRRWQVLPGRTHPLMMGKGGAEGYIFVATRVLPAEGKVSARGARGGARKKKADVGDMGSVIDEAGNGSELSIEKNDGSDKGSVIYEQEDEGEPSGKRARMEEIGDEEAGF